MRSGGPTLGQVAAEQLVVADSSGRKLRPASFGRRAGRLGEIELPGSRRRRLFGALAPGPGPSGPAIASARSGGGRVVAVRRQFAARPGGQPSRPDHPHPRQLLTRFRDHGWRGSIPVGAISLLAAAFGAVRFVVGSAPRADYGRWPCGPFMRPRRSRHCDDGVLGRRTVPVSLARHRFRTNGGRATPVDLLLVCVASHPTAWVGASALPRAALLKPLLVAAVPRSGLTVAAVRAAARRPAAVRDDLLPPRLCCGARSPFRGAEPGSRVPGLDRLPPAELS